MDDPRVWARGKTYQEVLEVGNQAVNALYQVASMPQQPAYQPPRQDDIADDDIVDGRRLKQFAAQYQQPQTDPNLQSQLAQLALSDVRNRHPKVFDKWGPEVMGEVAKLPPGMRTVDNLEFIVKIVRGNHADELAEELARTKFTNNAGLSVRSNGSAPGYPGTNGSLLESDELPTAYRDRLKKAGLTEQAVRSFCASSGYDFKKFVSDAKNLDRFIGEG